MNKTKKTKRKTIDQLIEYWQQWTETVDMKLKTNVKTLRSFFSNHENQIQLLRNVKYRKKPKTKLH